MLPQFYKFILVNSSGQTVTYNNNGRLNLKITAWYLDPSTGKVVYVPLSDDNFGFVAGQSLANGDEIKSGEIDNTSNCYLGAQAQVEVTHDEGSAAVGTFDLYLDGGDATGELSSDASGYDSAVLNMLPQIGKLRWHSSGVDDEVMRSPLWDI